MRILAADTSSARGALALYNNGEIIEMYSATETPTAARFFVLLDAVLSAARLSIGDIEYLALGAGPGSFTGLRVSFAAFRTLAWARGLPLYPVPSLQAMAHPYRSLDASLVVRTSARRGQVYQCAFRGAECIGELAILSHAAARERAAAWPGPRFLVSGYLEEGCPEDEEAAMPCIVCTPGPDAASVAQLALEAIKAGPPPKTEDVLPLYLRPSDAEAALAVR